MVQMSHQNHRRDNEHEFLLDDSTSFKEDDSDSDTNENADDEHTRSSNSTTSCQDDYPVNIVHKNHPSNLFLFDHNEDDDFPLLFGGNHGLESSATGGESGPGLVFPVGGMRRVSSCYFSITSAASSTNNNEYFSCVNGSSGGGVCLPGGGATICINDNNNLNSTTTSSVHNINNMDDFLMHDILMNVFSYLDGRSLASFSETARRPNFECFYFLELQLQRALLVGDSHSYCGPSQENCEVDDYINTRVDGDNDASVQGDHWEENNNYGGLDNNDHHQPPDNGVIPSFEGSIAGTGVISRLAFMDRESARRIVQTYLDSNTSIHAMPLRHSLAYFRQVLLRYKHHPPFASTSTSSQSPTSFPHGNIPENMAKMALFFTFLGAAYMHHQGGDAMMPNIPGPSEVLNEENMEVLKNMMLKVGLAGGFLKAGKTMKEKAEQQHANVSATAASSSTNNDGLSSENNNDHDDNRGVDEIGEVRVEVNNENQADVIRDCHRRDRSIGTNERNVGDANSTVSLAKDAEPSSQQHRRSVSIGSLEDLSHMMPNASAIALRLYNAFANGNIARHRSLIQSNDRSTSEDPKVNEPFQVSIIENESEFSPKRRRRSKRSHKTMRPSERDVEGNQSTSAIEGNMTSLLEEEAVDCSEDELTPSENEEELSEGKTSPSNAIPHIMEPPLSPSSVILHSTTTAEGENNPVVATSFFSFGGANQESMSSSPVEDGIVPTGCVGAYAHAVKTAATEVTRLVKKQHRANFERLSPEEQIELGVQFIDACTSDDKLHIVKEILQKQKKMDVDRFFIGPDDTETCALHAAAFNGAEQVLKFLCGGIDERDPNEDCGLADVNVKDANGWTALHFAAGANSVTSVRVLAEHGAKLTLEASNGYTPFHWAERLSNEEVAAELERLGADNRFVGRWMFGGLGGGISNGDDRRIPFVSFLANQFFAFGR